jgi:hypothetical protein
MAKKKWAGKAWGGIKEGALTKKGWPNISKVVAWVNANPSKYGETVRQVMLIANGSGDPESRAKAKAAAKRLKANHKEE